MRTQPRSERGFTLIEAIVALLVLAFGMLAMAGFQINLARGSDIAKQRTEATRLAQQKIEELRSFEQIVAGAGLLTYASLATGCPCSDTPATLSNTTYARNWTVSGTPADLQRTVSVVVSWTDRANDPQAVTLVSVISKSDPADAGSLGVPPVENGILRRPKRRDINIPIVARQLGGVNTGRSTAEWGASGSWLVFNDTTGDVVARCTSMPTDITDLSLCTSSSAYLLLGFISDGSINNTDNFAWIPTAATLTDLQDVIGTPECLVVPATDPNKTSSDPGFLLPDFRAYACLVEPNDNDGIATTPRRWSGKLDVTPAPTGAQKLCRFDSNQDNPVTGVHENVIDSTLDNQNYIAIGAGSCPLGTTQHQ